MTGRDLLRRHFHSAQLLQNVVFSPKTPINRGIFRTFHFFLFLLKLLMVMSRWWMLTGISVVFLCLGIIELFCSRPRYVGIQTLQAHWRAFKGCRFSCCLFTYSRLMSPCPLCLVWFQFRTLGIVCGLGSNRTSSADSLYTKQWSGTGPAVLLLLLLAWSPTFFSNPRDIWSCSLDDMPLQLLLQLALIQSVPCLSTISQDHTADPPV